MTHTILAAFYFSVVCSFISVGTGLICPPPQTDALQHRSCAFGNSYDTFLSETAKITGCTQCIGECGACVCDLNASVVYDDIQQKIFCGASQYCKLTSVHLIMNFRTNGFQSEIEIERIQPFLIRLCGKVNGQCCNGNCTEDYQISRPSAMCNQVDTSDPLLQYIVTVYIIVVIFLYTSIS